MSREATLTDQQQRLADEYLVDLNATAAAIRAGYSEKSARTVGPRTIGKPHVAAYIAQRQAERLGPTRKKADEVLAGLERIAFADLGLAFGDDGRLLKVKEMPDAIRLVLSSFEVDVVPGEVPTFTTKIKMSDRLKALEILAKHHKLLVDRHEVDVGPTLAQLVLASFKKDAKP